MIASGKLNIDDTIVYLSILDNEKLAIVDKSHNFYLIDLATMEKEHTFKFKQAHVHSEKKCISFSPDGKYLAYSEKEQSVVRVIDLQKQKLHHSFPTLQNQIETLCFDPSSHYLVAGSITGRVYLWNLFATGQVSRLSSFPEYTPQLFTQPKVNYVSSACFSPSGDLVATSGYGGSIVITNIRTEVSPKRISPNHVRINSLCFIKEEFIVAGNIEGSIDVISLKNSQTQKHYQTIFNEVSSICVSRSGDFLLVAGHTRTISLIDLQKEKVIHTEYIQVPAKITSMQINSDDVLTVGCENGSILFFPLYPEDLLKLRIQTASYFQAYELLTQYPLLQDSPLLDELHNAWEQHLAEAIELVENKRVDDASRKLNKFSKIPAKTSVIKEFQTFISYYERFKTAVKHENYALAYSMAEQVQLLKRTSPYKEMEAIWDEAFLKAQSYIITEKTHQLFKVLEPFSRVTSKLCFIQVLVHEPEKFLEFVHFINTQAYGKIFALSKNYPCLKEISSYQKIIDSTDDLYAKFQQHILSADFELAELEEEALSQIPYIKPRLKELSHLLALAKKLHHYFQENKLSSCYTLIDKYPDIRDLPLVIELEKAWGEKMLAAEKEALLGHTKEIKIILGELITLPSRAQKIGMLLRLSFLTQIKLLIIKHKHDAVTKAIKNYIAIFGYDTELHNVILKLKKDNILDVELTPEHEHRRPRALWLSLTGGKVPDTILNVTAIEY